MKTTLKELHLAAQYLSAAGICYVNHQEDDSHTNLGWDSEKKKLLTHAFGSKKHQLAISLELRQLEWLENGSLKNAISLVESTHLEILNWINDQVLKQGLPEYLYEFHYELPYPPIEDNHRYRFDSVEISELAGKWDIGLNAFQQFLGELKWSSPIRIWSHHFDLGFYVQIDRTGKLFMGAGLAVPDTLVDDLYFYVSGWKKGQAVETKSFGVLDIGEWRSDWDGATLAAANMNENLVNLFLKLTKDELLKNN